MQKKHNFYLILFLLLTLLGALFYRRMTSAPSPVLTVNDQVETEPVLRHQLTSDQEVTALDLVEAKLTAEFKTYDFGLMLEAVNGLKADEKHYWAIYYNGEYAKVGLSDLTIKSGDLLELVYEEITF